MSTNMCGGCRGLGSHRRWCVESVGPSASRMGRWAEQTEEFGDAVGSNLPGAANHLYAASGLLRVEAKRLAALFQEQKENT